VGEIAWQPAQPLIELLLVRLPCFRGRVKTRKAGVEHLRQTLTLESHRVRRLANQEGEQANRFHQASEFVLGTKMPEIQHPLIEVLAPARLELGGDGLEQVVRCRRGGWASHRQAFHLPAGMNSPKLT
jgi:hypothetical protein